MKLRSYFLLGLLIMVIAYSLVFPSQEKIVPSKRLPENSTYWLLAIWNFGYSVSVSGDGMTLLSGAPSSQVDNNGSQGVAKIYILSGQSWLDQATLIASDGASSDRFGTSVSVSQDGNTALVGSHNADVSGNIDQGAAYVFTRSGGEWSEQAKLIASDGMTSDFFGKSVSVSYNGNMALIGATHGDVNENLTQGVAYVFVRSGNSWIQQAKLIAIDDAIIHQFGYSVSLSEDGATALIGAPYAAVSSNQAQGAAYVFNRTGNSWVQSSKLTASDGAPFDTFGTSVSLSGDGSTALVGAPYASSYQGTAYVFSRSEDSWTQQAKLMASDGAANQAFGHSVSLCEDGSKGIIGAPNAEAAYLFKRSEDSWIQGRKFLDPGGTAGDSLGFSLSLGRYGDTGFIGAPWANGSAGSIYVFSFLKEDLVGTWDGQGVYYRNSETAKWIKLASPADMIVAGDLDGDSKDDLIGIWPGQGGVFVKYSKTGAWAKLSSTAKHIAAGDMNGDGRVDFLGTWHGQGVFYRDSLSSALVKMASPADLITAGDLDGDGIDDLIGIWPAQGGVWVKYSKTGGWSKLSSTAKDIAAGDMNGDGRDDLLATWDGQGVYYRNSMNGAWVKMATPAAQVTCGDLDADGQDDLIGIWPTQGGVWVKYSATDGWAKLSSSARDIAAGKMRAGTGGSMPAQALFGPMGGYAQGPESLIQYQDTSSEGPGGLHFVYQTEELLIPQEHESEMIRIPGPGEPGFRCVEEKNLFPLENKERR